MKVFVYWNFHKKLFSIRVDGKVIAHARRILLKDVEFKVSEAGRQRVLDEGVKNVHAGVTGTVYACDIAERRYLKARELPGWNGAHGEEAAAIRADGFTVSYNPRRTKHFMRLADSSALAGADRLAMHANSLTGGADMWVPWGSEKVLDLGGNA